jgi:hypothetical protein
VAANALHMKSAITSVTLVDLSPQMLGVSRSFNAGFIHDAIEYMTSLDGLRQALETAFVRCKSGGMALFVLDTVRETFEPSTDHGGADGDGRSVRYLEWSCDPDETDTTFITDYVFVLREDGQPVRVEHDQHLLGLFSRDEWLRLLRETGFNAEFVIDPFDRHVFVARKPQQRPAC